MKIIIDENIAFAEEAFSNYGTIELYNGRKINNEILKNADALIIRSITNVNKELLNNTSVKFVGTATIGTDHVDLEYLKNNGIVFSDAKGCNSNAVAEYVLTGLLAVANKNKIDITNKTMGVIGYGNVGKKVVNLAEAIGLNVLVNDPPLERCGYNYKFSSLEEVLKCDIVSFHVPFNNGGVDNTYHLLNKNNIGLLKKDVILFNTARGAVVDNSVIVKFANENPSTKLIFDVWENEPICNYELVKKVDIATAHIAGYSFEGKVIGTEMIYKAFCNCFGLTPTWNYQLFNSIIKEFNYSIDENLSNNILAITKSIYDIFEDTSNFKKILEYDTNGGAKYFDGIRKNYKLRMEFPNYKVKVSDEIDSDISETLKNMRFKL